MMRKKAWIILFLTLSGGFNLSAYASSDISDRCLKDWEQSTASETCTLKPGSPIVGPKGEGCKILAICNRSSYNGNSNHSITNSTYATPKFGDAKRLVNCDGTLEYDRCKS